MTPEDIQPIRTLLDALEKKITESQRAREIDDNLFKLLDQLRLDVFELRQKIKPLPINDKDAAALIAEFVKLTEKFVGIRDRAERAKSRKLHG